MHAQPLYRSVGPDGKVSFSDQPPADAAPSRSNATANSNTGSTASLPYEVRQAASRYPVVLYSGPNCTPCDSGRAMLMGRGIPFQEKTITTADDADALKLLSGDTRLPLLTIGSQQLRGYSDATWSQYLNAANYPPRSLLPGNYRRPAATPLVTVQAAAPTGPAAPATPPTSVPEAEAPPTLLPTTPPAPVPGNNPAGIRF